MKQEKTTTDDDEEEKQNNNTTMTKLDSSKMKIEWKTCAQWINNGSVIIMKSLENIIHAIATNRGGYGRTDFTDRRTECERVKAATATRTLTHPLQTYHLHIIQRLPINIGNRPFFLELFIWVWVLIFFLHFLLLLQFLCCC